MKIENVLPTECGKHFFEGVMLDLHFRCEFLKLIENRKCAPRLGREYELCKFHNRARGLSAQLFSLRYFTGYSLSKIMKIRWMRVLGRPGGMRGALGGDLRGV